MPASLLDVLAEITAPGPAALPAPERIGGPSAKHQPSTPEPMASAFPHRGPSAEEVEARIARAAADAATQARAEAEARHAEALEWMRAEAVSAHERALAEARAAWVAEEGERLAELIREGLAAIEERACEAAARALAPLVDALARDKALTDLAESVATLMRAEPALVLRARGPADLGAALMARLGDAAAAIRFTPDDSPDLVVEGEDVVIETRLTDWTRRVAAEAA
ncbi:hypothetical protein [Salinarimonas ramus]|uniref:Uncharacterized protein n=1 Tax=Salinarimonas ramus TaxID=690164 RepID=A0A917Q6L7_9HYPH|nr:hypothetical protein [Salinarimonas ramus]GGK31053.1 hypothetical protein GCM10011322_17060 [Salinarimonas ramus]